MLLVKWDWTVYFIQAFSECSHVNFEITFFKFCNSKQKLQHQKFNLFIQNNFTPERWNPGGWAWKEGFKCFIVSWPFCLQEKAAVQRKTWFWGGEWGFSGSPWSIQAVNFLMWSCIFGQNSAIPAQDPSGICRHCGKCKTLWQRGVGESQDSGFCKVITLSWMWREHRGHSQSGKLEKVLKCGGCGAHTPLSVGIWV